LIISPATRPPGHLPHDAPKKPLTNCASLVYALDRRSSNACGMAAVAVPNADCSQQTFDVAAPEGQTGSQVLRMWWQESHLWSASRAPASQKSHAS
jgi:hypothetical protein